MLPIQLQAQLKFTDQIDQAGSQTQTQSDTETAERIWSIFKIKDHVQTHDHVNREGV